MKYFIKFEFSSWYVIEYNAQSGYQQSLGCYYNYEDALRYLSNHVGRPLFMPVDFI